MGEEQQIPPLRCGMTTKRTDNGNGNCNGNGNSNEVADKAASQGIDVKRIGGRRMAADSLL
jgi:hypothetical protein